MTSTNGEVAFRPVVSLFLSNVKMAKNEMESTMISIGMCVEKNIVTTFIGKCKKSEGDYDIASSSQLLYGFQSCATWEILVGVLWGTTVFCFS